MITEYGIGNGISLLIFAGIVGRLPVAFGQAATTITAEGITNIIVFAVLAVLVIAATVFVNEAVRRLRCIMRAGFAGIKYLVAIHPIYHFG